MIRLQIGSGEPQRFRHEDAPYVDLLQVLSAIEELRYLYITDKLQIFRRLEELRLDVSKEMDDLSAAVTKVGEIAQTAISTMNGLAAQQGGKEDTVKLVALTATLQKVVDDLGTAITATTNTPSA